MTSNDSNIDQLLAAALRGERATWPAGWRAGEQAGPMLKRIYYHGIAGLVTERSRALDDWPVNILRPVRDQAIALAMWELRHKAVLGDLLAALTEAGIVPLLLKGTAVAYDLYLSPATRARGDSDLLIAASDLEAARAILAGLGYRRQLLEEAIADDLALQEVWTLTCDAGTRHHIDLHWQLLDAPALRGVLAFGDCAADPLPLPRLGPDARSMNRPITLLHTCIHRAMHLTSPYLVDGVTYYGGDRLIWAHDIALLAGALSAGEWRKFTAAAVDQGVAAVCRDGLDLAKRTLGSDIPNEVMTSLGSARAEPASAYLLKSGQARRAWKDLLAVPGWRRKLAYVGARALPSPAFVRGKYPKMSNKPLGLLYARRMVDLIRTRRKQGERR